MGARPTKQVGMIKKSATVIGRIQFEHALIPVPPPKPNHWDNQSLG